MARFVLLVLCLTWRSSLAAPQVRPEDPKPLPLIAEADLTLSPTPSVKSSPEVSALLDERFRDTPQIFIQSQQSRVLQKRLQQQSSSSASQPGESGSGRRNSLTQSINSQNSPIKQHKPVSLQELSLARNLQRQSNGQANVQAHQSNAAGNQLQSARLGGQIRLPVSLNIALNPSLNQNGFSTSMLPNSPHNPFTSNALVHQLPIQVLQQLPQAVVGDNLANFGLSTLVNPSPVLPATVTITETITAIPEIFNLGDKFRDQELFFRGRSLQTGVNRMLTTSSGSEDRPLGKSVEDAMETMSEQSSQKGFIPPLRDQIRELIRKDPEILARNPKLQALFQKSNTGVAPEITVETVEKVISSNDKEIVDSLNENTPVASNDKSQNILEEPLRPFQNQVSEVKVATQLTDIPAEDTKLEEEMLNPETILSIQTKSKLPNTETSEIRVDENLSKVVVTTEKKVSTNVELQDLKPVVKIVSQEPAMTVVEQQISPIPTTPVLTEPTMGILQSISEPVDVQEKQDSQGMTDIVVEATLPELIVETDGPMEITIAESSSLSGVDETITLKEADAALQTNVDINPNSVVIVEEAAIESMNKPIIIEEKGETIVVDTIVVETTAAEGIDMSPVTESLNPKEIIENKPTTMATLIEFVLTDEIIEPEIRNSENVAKDIEPQPITDEGPVVNDKQMITQELTQTNEMVPVINIVEKTVQLADDNKAVPRVEKLIIDVASITPEQQTFEVTQSADVDTKIDIEINSPKDELVEIITDLPVLKVMVDNSNQMSTSATPVDTTETTTTVDVLLEDSMLPNTMQVEQKILDVKTQPQDIIVVTEQAKLPVEVVSEPITNLEVVDSEGSNDIPKSISSASKTVGESTNVLAKEVPVKEILIDDMNDITVSTPITTEHSTTSIPTTRPPILIGDQVKVENTPSVIMPLEFSLRNLMPTIQLIDTAKSQANENASTTTSTSGNVIQNLSDINEPVIVGIGAVFNRDQLTQMLALSALSSIQSNGMNVTEPAKNSTNAPNDISPITPSAIPSNATTETPPAVTEASTTLLPTTSSPIQTTTVSQGVPLPLVRGVNHIFHAGRIIEIHLPQIGTHAVPGLNKVVAAGSKQTIIDSQAEEAPGTTQSETNLQRR